MIIVAVRNFLAAIESFTKEDLITMTHLTGYGIVCSGDGTLGVYKLQMVVGTDKRMDGGIEYDTESLTTFVTKINIGVCERLLASRLIDFTLNIIIS